MTGEGDAIAVESFTSPEDLLEALWRHDRRWQPFPKHWIFRGQGSAEWSLVPTALRPDTLAYFGSSTPFRLASNAGEQLVREAKIVQVFLQEADRQGIPLPTESGYRWRDGLRMMSYLMDNLVWHNWPPEDLLPAFALAQHHGIPTRLLDWTEGPLIAAYFAACDAAKLLDAGKLTKDASLAVWAFDHRGSEMLFTLREESPVSPSFRLVRPPWATNRNLRAQKGVFTVVVDSQQAPTDPPHLPSLDELITHRYEEAWERVADLTVQPMRRLELRVHQAGKLMRLLADDHVSATYLFPGLGGVARSLLETRHWDLMYLPHDVDPDASAGGQET